MVAVNILNKLWRTAEKG